MGAVESIFPIFEISEKAPFTAFNVASAEQQPVTRTWSIKTQNGLHNWAVMFEAGAGLNTLNVATQ